MTVAALPGAADVVGVELGLERELAWRQCHDLEAKSLGRHEPIEAREYAGWRVHCSCGHQGESVGATPAAGYSAHGVHLLAVEKGRA